MAQKFKRTRLWVDPAFQFRLLLRVGLYLPLYLFLVFHVAFGFEVMRTVAADGPSKSFDRFYLDFLHQQLPLLVTVLLITPALLWDLLKFSHRVAGPLFRTRRVMLEMASGKAVPEFHPRKGDLMPELFQAFNALIKEWNQRVGPVTNGHAPDANGHAAPDAPAAELAVAGPAAAREHAG